MQNKTKLTCTLRTSSLLILASFECCSLQPLAQEVSDLVVYESTHIRERSSGEEQERNGNQETLISGTRERERERERERGCLAFLLEGEHLNGSSKIL
jgi:hypothetical protein